LAWHYHPLAWTVRCGNRKTPVELFSDDLSFLRAIERRTKLGHAFSDGGLRKILRTFSSTQSVSNFRPSAAAAVYHRFLSESGGVVWDMSAGFGGRLLGALACDRVDRYVATDPSTYSMDGLREMADELVPMAHSLGRRALEAELHRVGSEDFLPERNSLDLCFTSPPYFGWEQYGDEPEQSHKKFSTEHEWLHGFVGVTLRNCAHGLKRNGILAINIASVGAFPNLARVFLRYAQDNGWHLIETLQLQLSKMVGLKHLGKSAFKSEPIFVFRKR
jgi:DNA methylase